MPSEFQQLTKSWQLGELGMAVRLNQFILSSLPMCQCEVNEAQANLVTGVVEKLPNRTYTFR